MKRTPWLWLVPVVVVNACAPTTISGDDSGDAAIDANALDASSVDGSRNDAPTGDSAADSPSSQPDATEADADYDSGEEPDSSAAIDASVDDSSSDSGTSVADSSSEDAASDGAASEDAAADAGSEDAAADAGAEAGSDGGGGALSGYTVVQLAGAASCDSPAAWTETGFTEDDQASPAPMPLPFSFSTFGASASHWSVSTNGVVELWPSSAGAPTDAYSNEELPSTEFSAGMLAPFWDDLYMQPGSSVRYGVVGDTPTRRFIVDWNDIDTISEEQTLHFQVKLFEASNIVEFHYCSMSTTGTTLRHTGSSATIGAQSIDGASAVQVSYDADNAVASGSLIRLVPR